MSLRSRNGIADEVGNGNRGPNAGRLNARSVIIAYLLACCTVILALGLAGIDA